MKNTSPAQKGSPVLRVAAIGMMAAVISCSKFALSFIPNVETVTLLCGAFGYAFGLSGVLAVCVFVCIEPLIWGVGSWILLYFLYYPALAACFWLFRRKGITNRFVLTAFAVLSTVWFGVLSSLIDVGLFMGYTDRFWQRFSVYYLRGVPFYLTQILCNAVLYPLLFPFLSQKMIFIHQRRFRFFRPL
ncbi:MAG: hypothetical protein MJ078_01095 [Clostridia bacterium]|nr:hypothetical protein [Clostridia bacterium]